MLTFNDCLSLCDLTEEEIAAVAEHEHLTDMAALEYGDYLIHTEDGELLIKRMILDDIDRAKAVGNIRHVKELKAVLKHFVLTHPKAQKLIPPLSKTA